MSKYVAHFDGGTKKNCIYWGFQIWVLKQGYYDVNLDRDIQPRYDLIKESNGFTHLEQCSNTNNEAEYTALIKLLEELKFLSPLQPILIKGDSKLVIEQVFGNWKVKADNLKQFNKKAKMLVVELYQHKIEIMASHSSREEHYQIMVDKWARQAFNGKKVEHTDLQHQGGEII